jgi:phosphoadenosine phosphosulfate reductase
LDGAREKRRWEALISPKIEESRIRKALRDCKEHGFEVLEPLECVKKAVAQFGDSLVVSCSFGSCSVVVLHMALQLNPNIKVVFNNTGVEYPETYAYRDLLKKEWNLNLIETKPIKSFWQCVKQYGFPLYRGSYKKGDSKLGKPSFGKPKCCVYLKELPFKKFAQEHTIKATITGLRAGESRARMFAFSQFGQNYSTKKFYNIMKINPIAFWTHGQVWQYLKDNNIPINEIYLKGKDRSGCMPCTGFLHWEQQLAKTNVKMYHYVQKLRGVSLMDDFLNLEDENFNRCDQGTTRTRQRFLEEWF